MLNRDFYLRDAKFAAPELLGKLLVHESKEGVAAGMIVEAEVYSGLDDKGSHAYPNLRSPRTEIQFSEGGYAYIYLIYGMHSCFNVVMNRADVPQCILIRALEPISGIELMRQRRGGLKNLCNGPGKLCAALGITRDLYGSDLCKPPLYLEEFRSYRPEEIGVTPRINIDYAQECRDYLWRYTVKGNPHVSRVPKRYETGLSLQDLIKSEPEWPKYAR